MLIFHGGEKYLSEARNAQIAGKALALEPSL